MNFNTFNNFNELAHFQNNDMIIFPDGLYQKTTTPFVNYLRLITSFDNSQYQEALNNLSESDRREMEAIKHLSPNEMFEIVDLSLAENNKQSQIYNTALSFLKNENLGDRTFKIDLFVGRNDQGKTALVPYIPKQYNENNEDKILKENESKNNIYLLAEYYFSTGEIDPEIIQAEPIKEPHLLVVCEHFSARRYSLTENARYYTGAYNHQTQTNVLSMLSDKLRDSYFLTMREELDDEIKKLVSARWNKGQTSIINYQVNPDIVLSDFNPSLSLIKSYKNLNLQEPFEDNSDFIEDETNYNQNYEQDEMDYNQDYEQDKTQYDEPIENEDESVKEETADEKAEKKSVKIKIPPTKVREKEQEQQKQQEDYDAEDYDAEDYDAEDWYATNNNNETDDESKTRKQTFKKFFAQQ